MTKAYLVMLRIFQLEFGVIDGFYLPDTRYSKNNRILTIFFYIF